MSQSLTKTNTPDQVDCLLIPLKDKNLLLPNVTVAEIIPFSHLLTTASSVDWILGRIDWRGTAVPVVCYEMLNNHHAPAPNPNARFAVINGVGNNSRLPFYALLIQGIPRLVHVAQDAIQEVEAMNQGAYDQAAVTLDGENAMIPDLERVESTLINHI
ncbi:chemotaxis protein CheW [Thalassolituus sp. LLYu03]|uniref:chemotaxis protein CheW n=1 Tax=Thalassolituus sp. LLYu03 TaxID=3421656 RepID=UPI003D2CF6CD